jgi:hypothetical protein
MRVHVHTKITSNTARCINVIDDAIDFVCDQQMKYLEPIGLQASSRPGVHNLPKWFSHMFVDKRLGRMMQRHPNDQKTPDELLNIYTYLNTLAEYNEMITGDCNIEASFTIG